MTTILVVDDSESDRRLAGGLLEKVPNLRIEYAEDGLAALNLMKDHEPDVVVSDLQMPKFDGLKLVQAMSLHHSHVPLIMITGHGSEDIAIEALEQGAASYVPKSQLAARLEQTVQQVIEKQRSDRSYDRLIECSTKTEFVFALDNDPSLIDPLTDLVQQIAVSVGVCPPADRLRFGLAIEEALLNAMVHGNLEITTEELQASRESMVTGGADLLAQRRSQPPYRDRRVHVEVTVGPEQAVLVIRDEGAGFDTTSIPMPKSSEPLESGAGRGLVLMHAFLDEVRFNEVGNEVTLVKRRPEPRGD